MNKLDFLFKHLDKALFLQALPLPTLLLLPSQFLIDLHISACMVSPPEALISPLPSSHSPNQGFVFLLYTPMKYPYHSTYPNVLELSFYSQLSPPGYKFLMVKDVETSGSWNIVYAWKVFLNWACKWIIMTFPYCFHGGFANVIMCHIFPQFQNLSSNFIWELNFKTFWTVYMVN